MKINWENIFALILVVTVIILFTRFREALALFTSNIGKIGPGHSTDEQTLGLIALGLIGVCVVAIVRILTRK